jgi:hypothetical protein
MRAVIKGALAAALLAGSSLAGTAPAEARDHTGTAILAGIIGLGVGAAIASSDHQDRYYSNDGYYSGNGYGYDAPANYYVQPSYGYGVTYDRGYYDRGYYGGRGYDRHDRHDRHWDHDRRDYDRDRGDHDRRW